MKAILDADTDLRTIKFNNGSVRLSNPEMSSVDLIYERGDIMLVGESDYEDNWGTRYWEPLLKDKNVSGLYLDNVDYYMLLRTPENIKRVLVNDISHLNRIGSWVNGEERGDNHSEMTLRYTGKSTKLSPVFETVNPDIIHLQVPLVQDLHKLVEDNPHLKSVGVDLDKVHLGQPPIPVMIWSSNPHRTRMIRSNVVTL